MYNCNLKKNYIGFNSKGKAIIMKKIGRKGSACTMAIDLCAMTIIVFASSKYITSKSNKLLSISPSTIYTVMYKLENEHMISEYSVLVGKKRTRVYYHIEADGETYLEELHGDYKNMISAVSSIFDSLEKEGKQHD